MYAIGIDVGGTFTDLVAIGPDRRVVFAKAPSTPQDQSLGVMAGLDELARRIAEAGRGEHAHVFRLGGWSEREFHDRVLREGSMPIGLLRERLFDRIGAEAPREPWRFLDSPANASAR